MQKTCKSVLIYLVEDHSPPEYINGLIAGARDRGDNWIFFDNSSGETLATLDTKCLNATFFDSSQHRDVLITNSTNKDFLRIIVALLESYDKVTFHNDEGQDRILKHTPLRMEVKPVPKDLAAVCCYFNPCGYSSRLRNYLTFRDAIKSSNVPLLTVELAIGGAPFELHCQDVIRLRAKDVLWHKERLLNVGIHEMIDRGYDKIAWLDADITFEYRNWASATSEALDEYPLCQLFKGVHKRRDKNSPGKYERGFVEYHDETGRLMHFPGHSGYAWAARADVFNRCDLFDRAILGGGDALIALASYCHGDIDQWYDVVKKTPVVSRMPKLLRGEYLAWASKWGSIIEGRVGFVDQRIRTLYHGLISARRYDPRYDILTDSNFDPVVDMKVGAGLCWEWNGDRKRDMHNRIKEYFTSRQEDE